MERVEYIKPTIEIVKIYSQTILAGSPPESVLTGPDGKPITGGPGFGDDEGTGNDF
ncbi:MAG: hypothetical protein SPE53_08600 [Prevotella sp.]|nr:hypothetical protein [Prevotella sp.]